MNNENDSSDSDGANYESDGSEDLTFESDEEGNFAPNPLKHQVEAEDSDEDEEAVGDSEEDEGDGEEASDEYESGDEEELDDEALSGEEGDSDDASDVETEDEGEPSDDAEAVPVPSTSKELPKGKSSIIPNGILSNHKAASKPAEVKTNGVGTSKSETVTEVGHVLRIKPTSGDKPNAVDAFTSELNKADKKKNKGKEKDEYADHDTSDEEDIRNTVGNIPMQWYDEYKHIGYDWDAKKIIKPPQRDQLDDFLKRMEDPNFWRTVKDPQTGQDVILSDADIELIKRINAKRIPDANYDDYAVSVCLPLLCLTDISSLYSKFNRPAFFSRGSNGSHRKQRRCQFAMFPITNDHSFRRSLRKRRCRGWCMPSKWAGSKPKRRKKRSTPKKVPNSTCYGNRTQARRTCVASTIMYQRRNEICLAMPNRTIRHPNISSMSVRSANGTNSKTNPPGANYTSCRKNSIRCARCPYISAMCVSVFCAVSICICVRVQNA